jgi:hypothetical protein
MRVSHVNLNTYTSLSRAVGAGVDDSLTGFHALSGHHGIRILIRLTQSRIEHVQGHLVAFLRASNSDKALVVVILWLVDLNDATRELTDLVDLRSSFANDGTDHVIRDEDLLGDGLAWYHALHWLLWWACMTWLRGCVAVRLWLLRTSANVGRAW